MTCRTIYKNNRFPPGTKIVGYARSALTIDNVREKCKQYMKVSGSNWLVVAIATGSY